MDIEKAIKLLTENSYIVERDTDLLGSFEHPITDIHLAYTRIVDMMVSRKGKEGVDGQLLCYVMNLGHDKEIPPPKRLLCKEDYDLFLMFTPNEIKELFLRIAPQVRNRHGRHGKSLRKGQRLPGTSFMQER